VSSITADDSSTMTILNDFVKESSTGILFPVKSDDFVLAGCGVRFKFGFIKGYALGTYVDPMRLRNANRGEINRALLNPNYARRIRIVMNRSVPIDMFNSSMIEFLSSRMNGEDIDKLNELKELGPRQDLAEGDIIELLIEGDILRYMNSLGGDGHIQSVVLTNAICDAYYGDDCASPSHKEAVIQGISSMH
jgi:hypothetical protein